MIVLEGPSRVGKTTLKDKLLPRLGIAEWQRIPALEKWKADYEVRRNLVVDQMNLLNSIDFSKVNLFVDRHPYISEFVYAMMHNRCSLFKPFDDGMLEDNICIINMRGDWHSFEKVREQMLYDGVMQWAGLHCTVFDVDTCADESHMKHKSVDELAEEVMADLIADKIMVKVRECQGRL